MSDRPAEKPNNPNFSSGPCTKRPGWTTSVLETALLGRSHRAKISLSRIQEAIELQREILGIPKDYLVGIVPGSDTGAFEMALWNMLGERGVDVLSWEVFSKHWMVDIKDHLQLEDVNYYTAEFGEIPNLEIVDSDRDVVFAWNGTTSGVRVPHAEWINEDRKGLTFCDATSAVFAYDMPWDKLDVTTWSWQKCLGGEAAHGMLVLSPRAVERLESFVPADRPLPKLFRMTKGGKVDRKIFEGSTINTISMMAVEDCLDALRWIESAGGLNTAISRSQKNFEAIEAWLETTDKFAFLAEKPELRSRTSVCLKITDAWFEGLEEDAKHPFVKDMTAKLDAEGIAFDVNGHRLAAPGIRIWCGPMVEASDVEALMPWIEWAFEETKSEKAGGLVSAAVA